MVGCDEVQTGIVVRRIKETHERIANEAIRSKETRNATVRALDAKFQKLERLLFGVSYTEEVTDRTKALIVSFGERLAVILMQGVLEDQGTQAKALEADAIGIITDASFENATADLPAVKRNLKRSLLPLLRKGVVPVITGYFGCTPEGKITTFGRNGSDYSAAVVAYGLGADRLEIWKDVEGFMTADPKFVPGAKQVDRLSYYEAAELSYFGARILHPRTVEPLIDADIPIHIRSVEDPAAEGTIIHRAGAEREDVIRSVTCNRDIAVLKIHGAGVGHKPGIIGELGKRLSESGINIYSVITSQTCINLLLHKNDAARGLQELGKLSGGVIEKVDVLDSMSLIAVVGEGLLKTKGLAAKVFTAVAREKVNVEMISAGASDVAYYFIVDRKDLEKAINAVHSEFYGK
jgi:aspartate kinase